MTIGEMIHQLVGIAEASEHGLHTEVTVLGHEILDVSVCPNCGSVEIDFDAEMDSVWEDDDVVPENN